MLPILFSIYCKICRQSKLRILSLLYGVFGKQGISNYDNKFQIRLLPSWKEQDISYQVGEMLIVSKLPLGRTVYPPCRAPLTKMATQALNGGNREMVDISAMSMHPFQTILIKWASGCASETQMGIMFDLKQCVSLQFALLM